MSSQNSKLTSNYWLHTEEIAEVAFKYVFKDGIHSVPLMFCTNIFSGRILSRGSVSENINKPSVTEITYMEVPQKISLFPFSEKRHC